MAEFFQSWSPQQFTLLVMTVGIAATVIVFILAIAHYQLRALADHTALERERAQAGFALRQELVGRNLPAAELRAALDALGLDPADAPRRARAEPDDLLGSLLACGADMPPGAVEEVVALVAAADPPTRAALAKLVADATDNDTDGERVFAAVRGLCKAAGRKGEPVARAEPAAEPQPRRDLDLQLVGG